MKAASTHYGCKALGFLQMLTEQGEHPGELGFCRGVKLFLRQIEPGEKVSFDEMLNDDRFFLFDGHGKNFAGRPQLIR